MEACGLISSMDQTLQQNSQHLPWSNNSQSLSIRLRCRLKRWSLARSLPQDGRQYVLWAWPHLLSRRAPGYFEREVWIGRGSPPKRYENAGSAQFPVFPKIYTGACNCSVNSSVGAGGPQNGLERFWTVLLLSRACFRVGWPHLTFDDFSFKKLRDARQSARTAAHGPGQFLGQAVPFVYCNHFCFIKLLKFHTFHETYFPSFFLQLDKFCLRFQGCFCGFGKGPKGFQTYTSSSKLLSPLLFTSCRRVFNECL